MYTACICTLPTTNAQLIRRWCLWQVYPFERRRRDKNGSWHGRWWHISVQKNGVRERARPITRFSKIIEHIFLAIAWLDLWLFHRPKLWCNGGNPRHCAASIQIEPLGFVTNAIEDGWQRTLLECMFGLRDATRAYFRMACELIRSFRHGISPPPSRNIIQSQRVISGGVPPPLVVIPQRAESDAETGMADGLDPSAKGQISEAGSSSPSTASSTSSVPHAPMGQEEIEPAFLNEKDYPPGWLVYHPVLGVVKKEEADQFDGDHPHLATHTSILSTSITASRHWQAFFEKIRWNLVDTSFVMGLTPSFLLLATNYFEINCC